MILLFDHAGAILTGIKDDPDNLWRKLDNLSHRTQFLYIIATIGARAAFRSHISKPEEKRYLAAAFRDGVSFAIGAFASSQLTTIAKQSSLMMLDNRQDTLLSSYHPYAKVKSESTSYLDRALVFESSLVDLQVNHPETVNLHAGLRAVQAEKFGSRESAVIFSTYGFGLAGHLLDIAAGRYQNPPEPTAEDISSIEAGFVALLQSKS